MRASLIGSFIFLGSTLTLSLLAACGDTAGNPILAASPGEDAAQGGASPAQDGGSTGDGKSGDDGGDAAPNRDPALAVASNDGVHLWKHAAALASDTAPDATLGASGLSDGASSLAGANGHLWVGRAAGELGVLRFDDAASLTSASTPSATLPTTAAATSLAIDGGLLWANLGGTIAMFADATTAPAASFVHPFEQIMGNAYDPVSDRLFGGQISGAGVLAWNQAHTKTGPSNDDFVVADGGHAYWTMQIAQNRLYAAGAHSSTESGVAIWPNASGISGPAAPITLTDGYDRGKFISHLIVRDDVLAVAARDQDVIYVYEHASAITANRAADFTLTHPSLVRPNRLAIDANARLYAIDDDGIVVFANVSSTPAFVTEIKSGVGQPSDIALIE